MKKSGRSTKEQELATADMHSFHIQLPADELRRLRIMAAEQGTSAGKLARELLLKAMDGTGRGKGGHRHTAVRNIE